MTRPTPSSLALTATAALLVGAVATVAGPVSSASAATGPSVVVVPPTATGKPGVARTVTVKVTTATGQPAPDGTPVAVQLDHGFLTSGSTTPGARAGDLAASATSPTVSGGQGVATFQVAIARDPGFDDDGAVTGALTASVNGVSGSSSMSWSSADPLNGGSVDVALSPRQEQAVAPTVTGDRTYYDVVARDQFGNPVAGAPIRVLPTPTADWDSSDDFTSDLASFGDFWVVNGVAGDLVTDVDWADAPTAVYSGATGQTTVSTKTLTTTVRASYYDVSFGGSTYAIGSSADGNLAVGTTVTKTVTVRDQLGRPVRGLDVQFFRFGPDSAGGDQKVDRETNSLGQASYSFVGSGAGTAKVTAVVSDGLSRKTLTSENGFRYNVGASVSAAKAKDLAKAEKKAAKGKQGKGAKAQASDATDVLAVRSDKLAEGATVSVYVAKGGKLKAVKAKGGELDAAGRTVLSVKDKNGKKATSYVVVVGQTATTFSATSAPAKVK